MSAYIARPSGDDWQNWANQLLNCYYGPADYQIVPDNDKGDAGIEGFAVSHGHAYQAYGCEEPLTTKARFVKQRTKMTDDITKFIENKAALSKIFGTVKITRWVLFVPYFDSKDIVAHAATKTAEVIDADLPYVDKSFRVKVSQEDDFAVERDKLLNAASEKLKIQPQPASAGELQDWSANNSALVTTLDSKLKKLPTLPTDEARKRFRNQVLQWYVDGQGVLERLREYPEIYERVLETKLHREGFLAISSVLGNNSTTSLKSALDELKSDFQNEVKALHAFSAETLSYEALSDWLLRCPLDFPETTNV